MGIPVAAPAGSKRASMDHSFKNLFSFKREIQLDLIHHWAMQVDHFGWSELVPFQTWPSTWGVAGSNNLYALEIQFPVTCATELSFIRNIKANCTEGKIWWLQPKLESDSGWSLTTQIYQPCTNRYTTKPPHGSRSCGVPFKLGTLPSLLAQLCFNLPSCNL